MFDKGILLGLFSETSLHPGTGTTTGAIDLPVQRERHTGFPIMQASGLKGALREVAEKKCDDNGKTILRSDIVDIIFGPENSEYAGAIGITDARILAFPVRSLSEVYVWITCPMVLERFRRDIAVSKVPGINLPSPSISAEDQKAYTAENSGLKDKLILEEIMFTIESSQGPGIKTLIDEIIKLLPADSVYEKVKEKMKKDLVVISNNDFAYLVKNATQVSARIELKDNSKTSNNLWYEESLPSDCLFYTIIFVMSPRVNNSRLKNHNDVIAELKKVINSGDYVQIGGNETVGMGWCAVKLYDGGAQ